MLRLPKFEIERPTSIADAVRILAQAGDDALIVAGGTDLVPNMKHELFTPRVLVSLGAIPELCGIDQSSDGSLTIGAMTTIETVAESTLVRASAPALAQAASLIAGPQLRSMGTLGGNVMLDTRCQWYNQTYFWRNALGFCLKKDGSACHVVAGGSKCVAAASNDSAPALMTLAATLEIHGPRGRRSVPIDDFWIADGIHNKRLERGEILARIRVPAVRPGHRGAYGKLRDRGSIDFPLLGVAVRVDVDERGVVADADVVLTALQARPVRIKRVRELLHGVDVESDEFDERAAELAAQAFKQCHPMPNIPGDADYRREMVPVYVRRTLQAARARTGPVHHL